MFSPGDKVQARESFYPHLTKGEECVVVQYEPSWHDKSAAFTWPAYLTVRQDSGKEHTYHASRFVKQGEDNAS